MLINSEHIIAVTVIIQLYGGMVITRPLKAAAAVTGFLTHRVRSGSKKHLVIFSQPSPTAPPQLSLSPPPIDSTGRAARHAALLNCVKPGSAPVSGPTARSDTIPFSVFCKQPRCPWPGMNAILPPEKCRHCARIVYPNSCHWRIEVSCTV
jgi:hypothetical protein